VIGLAAWAGSTGAGATTTTTGTGPTTTVDPPGLAAAFVPCDAPAAGGPCQVDPTSIQVPAGTLSVQLSWAPQGTARPAGNPVIVTCSKGACPWPAAMTVGGRGPWILNGTYTVTSGSLKVTIGLAVPGPAPANVRAASVDTGGVTVTWSAPSAPAPDAVGYQITRFGQPVYTCSTAGSAPVSTGPCPAPLVFHDSPGSGIWTYGVTTLRYGKDAAATDVVASAVAIASVDVPAGAGTFTTQLPAGGGPDLTAPTLPIEGSIVAVPPSTTVPSSPTTARSTSSTTTPPQSSTTIAATPSPTLPYKPSGGQTSALGASETGPKNPNLDTWAAAALGLLALALLLQVWYLRRELSNYTARHRRRSGSLPSAHGQPLAP
jgi:hypothetical protein